jgi:hypothetical protein
MKSSNAESGFPGAHQRMWGGASAPQPGFCPARSERGGLSACFSNQQLPGAANAESGSMGYFSREWFSEGTKPAGHKTHRSTRLAFRPLCSSHFGTSGTGMVHCVHYQSYYGESRRLLARIGLGPRSSEEGS